MSITKPSLTVKSIFGKSESQNGSNVLSSCGKYDSPKGTEFVGLTFVKGSAIPEERGTTKLNKILDAIDKTSRELRNSTGFEGMGKVKLSIFQKHPQEPLIWYFKADLSAPKGVFKSGTLSSKDYLADYPESAELAFGKEEKALRGSSASIQRELLQHNNIAISLTTEEATTEESVLKMLTAFVKIHKGFERNMFSHDASRLKR